MPRLASGRHLLEVEPMRFSLSFYCRRSDYSFTLFPIVFAAIASVAAVLTPGLAAEQLPERRVHWAKAAAGDNVNQLAVAAAEAVASDSVLAGAFLDVNLDAVASVDGKRRFVFRRVLDPDRLEEQRAAMDRIMSGLVPDNRFRVDASADRVFPYSAVSSYLRKLVRSDVRFPGCEFLDGRLRVNPTSDDLEFVPRFRVARDGQYDALADATREFLSRRPETSTVIVRDDGEKQKVLVAERPDPELNKVFAELQQATRQQQELHGAAIDVEIDDQGHPGVAPKIYVFKRTLDSGRVDELLAAVDTLTRQVVPSGRIRFDTNSERTLPVSGLLYQLRLAVDVDPRFAGCAISHLSLAYSADGNQIDVVIHGRVWKSHQIELLADLARRLMRQDLAWEAASAVVQTANRDDLSVILPAPDLAARYYGEAMKLFYAHNYESADKLLALASTEDPRNVVYRYWRVLGLMARGDESSAEDRLAKTIQGFGIRPQSHDHLAVMRAIYRVQGPLRHDLINMENRIMAMGTMAKPSAN